MPNRSATTAGILPAYAGTEITATSSSVIETALKSSPLSVRSTVTVFLPSAPATRPDTFCVPPVGLNTISNTLIEAPSPYAWQRVKPFSHSDRVYGAWGSSPFWCARQPDTPTHTARLFDLHNSRYRLHIFTGYRRVLLRYPIPARAKKRSILQRDRASTAAGGQNCRAPYHSKSRHGENDAPLLRKTAKSDSERSLGISEGHRWRRRIICRQLELQNTPKNARRTPWDPLPHGRKQVHGIL